jgi:hypothetical protein
MDAFWQAVSQHDWTVPENRSEFRIYYDESGNITCYSMEDLPGDYIVVDRHTFEQVRMDLKIRNGQLIKITQQSSWKLMPTDQAEYACHNDDVSIIVPPTYPKKKFWKVITTNEEN